MTARRKGRIVAVVALFLLAAAAAWTSASSANDTPSTCYGRPAHGKLENGWQLPSAGPNYRVYSDVGWGLGRTYVHSDVHRVVLAAYDELGRTHPALRFVYGETGWASGGRFRPHRTHRNGLSVDFMVPLQEPDGSRELPTSPLNKWGYDEEFDAKGAGDAGQIDFEAVAAHLAALARAARSHGVAIRKVIFAPDLQKHLRRAKSWKAIRHLPYTKKPVWVRHDDHYHVDFGVRCRPYEE